MKNSRLLTIVAAAASTLFVALSARAEFTCELSFLQAPSTALANFPVLVRLAEDAPTGFHYADCPTASCIWFTDENDDAIPCDVDTWDTTGESLVWVSVPSLSSSAKITMHWDASGAPAGQPASSQVWSLADYVGVWHMNELVYDSTKEKHYTPDSSASGWNAYKVTQSDAVPAPVTTATGVTANPTPLTGTAMNIAYGAGKDNAAFGGFAVPMAQTSSFTLGGSGFTLSAIVNSQQAANNGRCRVIAFGAAYNEMANLSVGCDNIYVMGASNHLKTNPRGQTDWVYSAGVFNSPRSKIYADGVCLSGSNDGNPSLASLSLTKGIGLGCFIDGKNTLDGYLDEARIRNVASTGEWVAEEYKTVTTANYVTFGDVEGGSGSVEVLRLSTPTVSDITVVSATVSGRLTKFGEGATSASVSLHYTDGGAATNTVALGSTNAVPAVFTAALANLTPSTAYTVWFSAVNNAETPASTNSVATVFSTGADATEWDTATATFTPDGRTISATVDITNVGSGTSTLYLMKGSGDTATVAGFVPVTSSGTKTVVGDFSDLPWGSRVYYSLMLVNGTEANAVTNTFNPNAYNDLQDNSTYTWIGGASGVWNDPTQWNRTTAGNLASEQPAGYPVFGSTAAFAEAAGNDPVTVTIPATPGTSVIESTPPGTSEKSTAPCWVIATLNYDNMKIPLTFTSETTDWTSHLHIRRQTQNAAVNLTFDHCAVWIEQQRFLGANSVDANGKNSIYTFTSGTVADWSTIYPERPGVAIRVKDGAWLKVGAIGMCGVSDADHPPVFEVEDAELRCAGPLTPDSNGTSGALYRLLGSHPKLEFVSCQTAKDNSTDVVEFFVPVGGYTEPPLHFWGDAVINSSGKANLTLRIAADSPALSAGVATTTRFVNGKVADGATAPKVAFDLPTGVTTSTFTDPNGNADGYVVSIPAGAGPALANVGIASCKDNSFTIAGTLSIATANESATITSYVAEDGGDFAAKGTTTSGGGVFSVKASGLVSGTKYRWYVEAVTPSGSFRTVEQVLTFFPGAAVVSDASVAPTSVDGEKVYVFTDSETPGSITFAKGGLVEVLVVGGGGAGGSTYGGGGGGGAFLHRDDFIPAGTYEVTVGKGGYNTNSSGTPPVAAESSSIGALFVAPGGGAGALHNKKSGTALGGSAGGDCGGNGTAAPLRGIWPFGTDGGATGNSGGASSPGAGGGGAGGPGSDRRTWGGVQLGGKGGDGVACSITGESVFYAAGGGGGAYNADLLPGAAGLGGVSGSAYGDAERHDAPANTGSGGGGGGPTTTQGGSGGSGIVVIRVKKFDKIGFSVVVR